MCQYNSNRINKIPICNQFLTARTNRLNRQAIINTDGRLEPFEILYTGVEKFPVVRMGSKACGDRLVTEPTPISDVFADGVVDIEIVGSIVRYVFSARHRVQGTDQYEHVVVAKIVLPLEAARELNSHAREALSVSQMVRDIGGHC